MNDQLPTAARVSDPGIRNLYRQEHRWQAWLDVEAALAKAEADLDIIPRAAAEAISRADIDARRSRAEQGFPERLRTRQRSRCSPRSCVMPARRRGTRQEAARAHQRHEPEAAETIA